MSTDDEQRQYIRAIFNSAADSERPFAGERTRGEQSVTEPPAPEPITGPVIPRQEATPAPQPQWTEQHRWANRLLSGGTAHEIY